MDKNYYTGNKQEMLLEATKEFLDAAYESTDAKYGKQNGYEAQARTAMYEFLMNYTQQYFTGKETRKELAELLNHFYQLYQVLFDFAISSYIVDRQNGIQPKITSLAEVHKYLNEKDDTLDYSPQTIKEVVAISVAENAYHAINMPACNKRLKDALIQAFIAERYLRPGRKEQLDNSYKSMLIKLPDSKKEFNMSKRQLNKDIDNMIRDDETQYYVPNPNIFTRNELPSDKNSTYHR